MALIDGLYPGAVFSAFEEISGIPHGSYHVDEISDYLKSFAERRGFSCVQDKEKNILVRVPASSGYENEPVLILQGHMDMVAVHEDPDVDMTKHKLKLVHDGEWLRAEGSSLGGDDGVAVAMMLAIMDDKSITHPELELLFTANEEVGMDGAVGLDASLLKGKRLLNLDSEDEGIFTVGCAGGVRVIARASLVRDFDDGMGVKLGVRLSGGAGGHSGQMIHLGRANAIKLLGRVLYELSYGCGARLVTIGGGTAGNAIPGEASLTVELDEWQKPAAEKMLLKLREDIIKEYRGRDDGISLSWDVEEGDTLPPCYDDYTRRVAGLLIALPDGVQAMSGVAEGLVETSLNLGIIKTDDKKLSAHFELRSMLGSAAEYLKQRVVAIIEAYGAEAEVSASYPEWEYREDSPLRDKLCRVYERMYDAKPKVEVIHAGLECGVLAKKIDGFDAVSIGPDMRDVHSVNERLNIPSTGRMWDFLLEVLREKDG